MGSYLHQHIWGWEPWINEDGKKSVTIPQDATQAPIWRENVRAQHMVARLLARSGLLRGTGWPRNGTTHAQD